MHHCPELRNHACDRTMCLLMCVEFPQPPCETFCTVNVGPFARDKWTKLNPACIMHHEYSFLSLFSPILRVYLSKKPKYCSDTVVFLLPLLVCPCFLHRWAEKSPCTREAGLEGKDLPLFPGRRVYRTGCPLVPGRRVYKTGCPLYPRRRVRRKGSPLISLEEGL